MQYTTTMERLHFWFFWIHQNFVKTHFNLREKGRDLTKSYDKSPYTHRKILKATRHHKTPPKASIAQRMRTNLGRSVQVRTATQLVWSNWSMSAQPSH